MNFTRINAEGTVCLIPRYDILHNIELLRNFVMIALLVLRKTRGGFQMWTVGFRDLSPKKNNHDAWMAEPPSSLNVVYQSSYY